MSIFLAGNRSLDIILFFVFSSKQKQNLHENLYFLSELKREPIGLHIKKQPRRWWQNQKVTVLLLHSHCRIHKKLSCTRLSKRFVLSLFSIVEFIQFSSDSDDCPLGIDKNTSDWGQTSTLVTTARTIRDVYPIPHIHDFAAGLAGCEVFSKIDLVKGYHQVPVRAEDVPKTAIATPFGLFEFVRMPFGLKNAAQTFQRLMDHATNKLCGVFVYLDDVLVASASPQQHERDPRELFGTIRRFGLVLNTNKCVFGVAELDFLGRRVSAQGIRPLPAKVEAVRRFERPQTVKAMQRFLGMVNFYRRFLPNIADTMRPLTDALAGTPRQLV